MPDRIADHYERHAHAFDEGRRTRFAERPWLDRFLLALPGDARILDLGCGGGEPIARYLIDAGHQLTGIDSSASMIELARIRFPRHIWIHDDMRAAAPVQRFHGVLAWDSLFHLVAADQAVMILKVARWLEPGGALLFNSGPAAGEAVGCQFDEALFHASLAPHEYRALLEQAGLVEIAFVPEDAATGGRSIWLARRA